MVFIDDAGVGCMLGTPVAVGYRPETGEKVIRYVKRDDRFKQESIKILDLLNVSKDEPIFVCHGSYFKDFRKYLQKNHYTYTSCKIEFKAQDIVEDAFMESLYQLGVPRQIILHGKNYERLEDELTIAIIANPELLQHFRYGRHSKKRMQKIENAIFRYPNLISNLLNPTKLKMVI